MSLNFFTKFSSKKVGGDIAHYHLEEWWFNSFTEEERRHILEKYQPIGVQNENLVRDDFLREKTCFTFLYGLASLFDSMKDHNIALKIIRKAEENIGSEQRILSLHFFYPTKMKILYKDRENPAALEEAIDSCIKQIELAPLAAQAFRDGGDQSLPVHQGYDQLCIIYTKQKKFKDAIVIAEQAQKQGWNGDWNKVIEKLKKRI